METIVQVAVKINDKIYTLPRPKRHSDVYTIAHKDQPRNFKSKVDGFITSTGRFVDRREAAEIAFNAHQIISDDFTFASLYSEDIF